jgi:hypothetical protein
MFIQLSHRRNGAMLLLVLVISSLVCSLSSVHAAPGDTVIYVNQNATGANTGTSWQDAYTDLQSALAVAQANHEIWIATGIYRPSSNLSDLELARKISFVIPNGVELYGGFVGEEDELSQRD